MAQFLLLFLFVMDETKLTFEEKLKKDGYSQEEEYFYRLNRELIEKQRVAKVKAVSTQPTPRPLEEKKARNFLKKLRRLFEPSEKEPKLF